jgi:hypothetical protein
VIFLPEIEALIEFDRPGDCWWTQRLW